MSDELAADGLAGEHRRSALHSVHQIKVCLEAAALTQEYAVASVIRNEEVGMIGLYWSATLEVDAAATEAVTALQVAHGALERLAAALLAQGAP